jgi:hypothetical protein
MQVELAFTSGDDNLICNFWTGGDKVANFGGKVYNCGAIIELKEG